MVSVVVVGLASLALFLSFVHPLPVPGIESGKNLPVSSEESAAANALVADVEKLKSDGAVVAKTEEKIAETLGSHVLEKNVHQESVADAKTGKLVATVEKTEEKVDEKPVKTETKIQLPAPAHSQDEAASSELGKDEEPVTPDEVAQYIYDTSDFDGIHEIIEELVKSDKLSQKDADEYMDLVREKLNLLHEEAIAKLGAQKSAEEEEDEPDSVLTDMLKISDILNTDRDVSEALGDYVKTLYTLYKKEEDEDARGVLLQYTDVIKTAADEGKIERDLQKLIYSIILKAMKEVDEGDLEGTEMGESVAKEGAGAVGEKAKRHGDD